MYRGSQLIPLLFLGSCLADRNPYINDTHFDDGEYGKYVTQTFRSNPMVKTPILNVNKPFTECDDGSYLFISPRGLAADPTPIILDPGGSPIWAGTRTYGEVYNFQVQQYKGESFLTFWEGDDAIGGHGAGKYHMLDKHYNERFRLSAANGLDADLHTFELTNDDTGLSTVYAKKQVPFTPIEDTRDQGWIWDSVFQELDLETGAALFEWRASEHFSLDESFTNPEAATEDEPWDVWHINSVQKDGAGNYLISFRFLRCVAYVDGRTSEILWRLGGSRNAFNDLSDGDATTFVGQHDARLSPDGRFLSLFDNRADWYYTLEPRSRGKRVELDLHAMTARLDADFVHPGRDIISISQGSFQTLPNGHVLLGYGFAGAMTEFSADGAHALCDVAFEPAGGFGSGDVQSYRNLKFNWTGLPDSDPDLVLQDGTLYVSWNGATEVRSWVFQQAARIEELVSASAAAAGLGHSLRIAKTGFETEVVVADVLGFRRYVRVVGVDADGNSLGCSGIVDLGDLIVDHSADAPPDADIHDGQSSEEEEGEAVYDDDDPDDDADGDFELLFALGFFAILSVLFIMSLALGPRRMLRPLQAFSAERTWMPGRLRSRFRKPGGLFGQSGTGDGDDVAARKSLMGDMDQAHIGRDGRGTPPLIHQIEV